jgi:hypothetical protein
MRLPVSSEADAFRSVFAAALAWMVARKPAPSSLREAEAERRQRSRRVLLVANETPTSRQLRDEILRRGKARTIHEVHAPVLQSRTHFVITDIDRETSRRGGGCGRRSTRLGARASARAAG